LDYLKNIMARSQKPFDAGKKLFAWTAHDYHPHDRGVVWHIIFCTVFFGGALWSALSDPQWGWVTAFSLCAIAAIYLFVHRQGSLDHEIQVFEKGMLIDERTFIHWEKIEQFWFTYDDLVSVINFDLKKNANQPIKLQMGEVTPEKFREVMALVEQPEAEGKEESVLDLWIRVLKL